jgi:hypothetical protein
LWLILSWTWLVLGRKWLVSLPRVGLSLLIFFWLMKIEGRFDYVLANPAYLRPELSPLAGGFLKNQLKK